MCKECQRELPENAFRLTRWGRRWEICNECSRAIRKERKQKKIDEIEARRQVYYAEFEGKEPVEVLQLMGRARRWLESRGYEIVLKGSLMVRKDIKFE